MDRRARKFIWDALDAGKAVQQFADGESLESFLSDDTLQSAIEWKFTVVGEALRRLRDHDPKLAAEIPKLPEVIGFRNILVHRYDIIDLNAVWRIIHDDLPDLVLRLEELLDSGTMHD